MTRRVVFRPQADAEVREARRWYEEGACENPAIGNEGRRMRLGREGHGVRPPGLSLLFQLAGQSRHLLYWREWSFASISIPPRVSRTSVITAWMKKRWTKS